MPQAVAFFGNTEATSDTKLLFPPPAHYTILNVYAENRAFVHPLFFALRFASRPTNATGAAAEAEYVRRTYLSMPLRFTQ